MPLPAIIPLIKLIGVVITAYEAGKVLHDIYEGLDVYNRGIAEAKEKLEETIRKLKEEIDLNIDERAEVVLLQEATAQDPQSEITRRGQRWGTRNNAIKAAVQKKIPFRRTISEVCERAAAMPVIQLRRKPGVHVSDLPNAKKQVLAEILRKGVETITDVDLEDFLVVRLKQLSASLMFEFIDYALEWRSPLKCEVSFGPPNTYTDHPAGDTPTRLARVGLTSPFYPVPAPNNQRGSISADLVIPEYRRQPCTKTNIFAIVEIKFEGDRIDAEQLRKYGEVLKEGARLKTLANPVRLGDRDAGPGGVALFRYPLDKAASDDEQRDRHTRASGGSRSTR